MDLHAAQDAKEQVRQATDIVDLVGGYMQLRRQGRGYVGLCPWHDDTRPSMQVNPDRQSFKCWVCDIGGDVFSFLMRIEGLEFREALEALADRAGITLAASAPSGPAGGPGDKRALLAALAWAEERFHRCLVSDPAAEPARRYLAERGVSQESITRFHIGYSPDGWDWLAKGAASTPHSSAVLERVGLILPRKSGQGYVDRFRGRVMFPIRDLRSRPIAFGGRVLPELAAREAAGGYTPAKYVNSPEGPTYSKSDQLYALDLARDSVQKLEQIVVMEGYTDVIMAHQHGVENVVAVCGTALGERHLRLIRRFTDSIALVLDGDEAGRKRANDILELFVANQVDLRILTLPDNIDPCDFIGTPMEGQTEGRGADAFRALLAAAPDAMEHKLRTATEGMVLTADNTHDATRAVEQVLATLAKTRVGLGEATSAVMLREQGLVARLSRRFGLAEEAIRRRLAELRRGEGRPATVRREEPSLEETAPRLKASSLPVWDREALELMLLDHSTANELVAGLEPADFRSELGRRVFDFASRALDPDRQEGAVVSRLMLASEDERLKSLLVELDESAQDRAESDRARRVHDLLIGRQRRRDDADTQAGINALKRGDLDPTQEAETLQNLFATRKNRQAGS
ncbi:DNA primase [Pseudobythopirellula maris]|uniref:DNA primase n=1 Tax=Pseudobythopirellula maris TaxID=2527991 RepID=A0A5C5ZSC2_9BACT|nr:DNA primase [Pseudobythopirellula maris]TWT90444.1 DNA primase [Pseudobythopirellula maris]